MNGASATHSATAASTTAQMNVQPSQREVSAVNPTSAAVQRATVRGARPQRMVALPGDDCAACPPGAKPPGSEQKPLRAVPGSVALPGDNCAACPPGAKPPGSEKKPLRVVPGSVALPAAGIPAGSGSFSRTICARI